MDTPRRPTRGTSMTLRIELEGVSSTAAIALARAWIAAQDDREDATRMDSVRVAADQLQAHGHPLGELVMLGLALLECRDASLRSSLRVAHRERVTALLAEALGPFASLTTHPQAFDMRWALCYLGGARLPIHKARRYAGLLGLERLDPAEMLARFLAQPAARCLRTLTLDLGEQHDAYPRVLDMLAGCEAPLEALVIWVAVPDNASVSLESLMALPYLHTLVVAGESVRLPDGDPSVVWTGQASSIRALGRAATGADPAAREQAIERIRRMGRNSGRYLDAMRANEPSAERRVRIDEADLLAYASEASSLDRQRAQLELDGVHPRWALWSRWRVLVPCGAWFGTSPLENMLRAHNKLHDSPELEPLSLDAMAEDPQWVEFRRQAEAMTRLVEPSPRT